MLYALIFLQIHLLLVFHFLLAVTDRNLSPIRHTLWNLFNCYWSGSFQIIGWSIFEHTHIMQLLFLQKPLPALKLHNVFTIRFELSWNEINILWSSTLLKKPLSIFQYIMWLLPSLRKIFRIKNNVDESDVWLRYLVWWGFCKTLSWIVTFIKLFFRIFYEYVNWQETPNDYDRMITKHYVENNPKYFKKHTLPTRCNMHDV